MKTKESLNGEIIFTRATSKVENRMLRCQTTGTYLVS